jgi:very-short-patch-repair endonuclease
LRRNQTPEEKILWQRLRRNQLEGRHFRRQQVIDGFIVDFYCHSAGLAVELDGGIHDQQIGYDRERDEVLARRGIRVFRVRNQEIRRNVNAVLMEIAAQCRAT